MTVAVEKPAQSFVVLPLSKKRIALPADSVIELVAPLRVQTLPHLTPWISGVIVRRNRIVPVCNVRQLFGEDAEVTGRFYLIAEWGNGVTRDWCAIPVCGECELAPASLEPLGSADAARECEAFACGSIRMEAEEVEVMDLAKLIQARGRSAEQQAAERT